MDDENGDMCDKLGRFRTVARRAGRRLQMTSADRWKLGSMSPGSAARKMAVDSFQNIANVHIASESNPDWEKLALDVARITKELSGSGAVGVGELAQRLHWDPQKAAEALTKAGQSGLVQFSKSGGTTTVELSPSIDSSAVNKK